MQLAIRTLIPLTWVLSVCLGAQVRGQGLQSLGPPSLLKDLQPDADDLDMRRTPVVRAVERASDSVVSIYVVHGEANDPPIDGQGSGVIIDDSGFVITNWHVVAAVAADQRRYQLQVRLRNGRVYPASLLSSSSAHDLALLQLRLPSGMTD